MDTSKRISKEREDVFPKLFSSGYGKTSDEDVYNCIAWAAGEQHTSEWWDPFSIGHGYYWPDGLDRNAELETFVKLYELKGGYLPCPSNSETPEEGIEKIAIFVGNDSEVTHAARQLKNGHRTSKLGDWEDIEHRALDALTGEHPAYGKVAKILRRPRPS